MIHLYLVRHGATEGEGLYIGRGSDFSMTEKGKNQIYSMSDFLKSQFLNSKIDSIYSSPMIRTVESAQILSRSFAKTIQIVPGLEEIDFGVWEGFSYDYLMKKFPEEFSHWIESPQKKRPPGGESLEDLQMRVLKSISFLKIAAEEKDEKNIVIVSHRGPILLMLLEFLGLGLEKFWNYKIERGSISKLNIYPRFAELDFLNRKF